MDNTDQTEFPLSDDKPDEPSETLKELSLKDWQRLSPIAMLYFLIAFIRILISNIVYMIPGLIVGYNSVIKNPVLWLPIIFALLAFMLVVTVLKFYFFQFRLSNGNIEIRSGVISKKHINLPFSRIQNVKLEQPIYFRPFDYTCLQLDTAGSAKQEAKIVALKVDFAEKLKLEILASHQPNDHERENKNKTNKDEQAVNPGTEEVINTRSISDLVIHGISNNRVWIFLGGFAIFFDDIAGIIGDGLISLGINVEQLFSFTNKAWWQIGFFALTLTFIVLLIITFFSILGSIISFYGYTLSKVDDRYIRRSGLFTRHEVSMKLSRLQMIVRQQDWLDLILKRINLKFEQNNSDRNQMAAGAVNSKIIVPSVKPEECQDLIDNVYPENKMASIQYQGISKRFLVRHIGYKLVPIFILVCAIAIASKNLIIIAWFTPVLLLLSLLVVLCWKRWGYYKDDNFIYVRTGMIGVDYICFPAYKVQQVKFNQSLFQKRRGLCSLHFVLASGSVKIPFIKQESAYQLLNQSLFEVESSKLSWM